MFNKLIIKKMRKERIVKRWSKEEEKVIIDFLLENRPFEKPSSRVYYTRLIEEKKMKATWLIAKGKVRHLRDNFEKVFISYQNKHLAPDFDQNNFTKERLYRLCPFYDQLLQLYTDHVNDQNSSLYMKLTKMEQNTTDTFLKSEKSQLPLFMSRQEYMNATTTCQSKSPSPTPSQSQSPTGLQKSIGLDSSNPAPSPIPFQLPTSTQIKEEAEEFMEDDPLSIKHDLSGKKKFKKWARSDVKQVVDFLQEYPDFEHPTARVYYTQLLNETSIDATWDMVKWKVRYMRLRLKYARNYLKHYDTDLTQTDEAGIPHERNLEKICPFFAELAEIFKEDIKEGAANEHFKNKFIIRKIPKNRSKSMMSDTMETSNASDISEDMTENEFLKMRKYDIVEYKLKLKEYELQQQHELELRKLEIEEKRMELDMELKKRKLEVEESLGKYELDLKYSKINNDDRCL